MIKYVACDEQLGQEKTGTSQAVCLASPKHSDVQTEGVGGRNDRILRTAK